MSTIQDEQVFAAVGRQLSEDGTMTLQKMVADTGVSIGSLYHRYGSREGLLALAWLDAVQTFQQMFLSAIESPDENAGERAALATPQFCRAHRQRANILVCCRSSEFISKNTPVTYRTQMRTINMKAKAAVQDYAARTGYSLEACRLGLVAFPLGAVRVYLPGRPVPHGVDDYISAAFRAVVDLAQA